MSVSQEIKYSLRPAQWADYQYCYKLTKRNMFDFFFRHWGGWNPVEFRKCYKTDRISIVIINGRRFGYLSVRADDQGIYIENIQLSPSLHGRGIGTDILRGLIQQYSHTIISLTTFSDNPAKQLYERLGFIETEHEGKTLRMTKLPIN